MRPTPPALAALALLAACTAPAERPLPAGIAGNWTLSQNAAALAAASCPPGEAYREPQALAIRVSALAPAQSSAITAALPAGISLAGAWRLSADDPNFGGLSGLAFTGADELIAVTDAGAFAWIALRGGVPQPAARMAYMRQADGRFLQGKDENDAEGLVYSDGLAIVSFERKHRIEAFALAACGAAARAVRVADLPDSFEGTRFGSNEGPEALWLNAEGSLTFGFEGDGRMASPLGTIMADGQPAWLGKTAENPSGFGLTARETITLPSGDVRTLSLFRSYEPVRGLRVVFRWGETDSAQLALAPPLTVDNFEGLATRLAGDGSIEAWILSDDNFSPTQQTLLYALRIAPGAG